MKQLVYQGLDCRVFLDDKEPILVVEYARTSPVHPGATIAYSSGDKLPSGSTSGEFLMLLQAASTRKRKVE